jgi:hypothetical protein
VTDTATERTGLPRDPLPCAAALARAGPAVLLALALAAGAARAAQEWPEAGGPGGAPFRSECPPGSHVVGFGGRAQEVLVSIEPLCAPLQAIEQKTSAGAPGGRPAGASAGGSPYSVACPPGSALGAWVFDTAADADGQPTSVRGIELECRALADPSQVRHARIGGQVGAQVYYIQKCPPGELATGIRGRAGSSVDALALVCAAPARPRPASAAPAGFAGTWTTRTERWGCEITFTQLGRQVQGTFLVQNGDTGRIRGTLTGNVLSFEWERDGGYGGVGQFELGPDGDSFSGSYRSNAHPAFEDSAPESGSWSGTRR